MSGLSNDTRDLATDYVLGLLPRSEEQIFADLIARDPELALHVGDLRDSLLPLDLSAPPRDLPEGYAATVLDRLGPQTPAPDAARVKTADGDTAAVVPVPAANLSRAPSRRAFGLIAASVLGIALGLGAGWMRPLPEPRVVAVLLNEAGVPQAVVEDYGNDTATVRFVADIDVPADRSLQVWTLPSAEIGAMSLGVLDRAGSARLSFEDLPGPAPQQLYEVTLEPSGGSPTGRPTGPIIGKGLAVPQTVL